MLKFRFHLPGFELPQPVYLAQVEFEDHLAAELERIADRLESGLPKETNDLKSALAHLEETARSFSSTPEASAADVETLLLLSRRLERLATSLDEET